MRSLPQRKEQVQTAKGQQDADEHPNHKHATRIQLFVALRLLLSHMSAGCWERPLPSHGKPECCAVADDVAGGGGGEMGADDEDRLVGPFGEEARSSERGGLRIVVAE